MIDSLTQAHTKAAIRTLLDTFSGADTSFVPFMRLLADLDRQAANGDEAAQQIIRGVVGVARLITLAEKGR